MTENIFYSNCELWSKFNPKQAVLLPYLEISHLSMTRNPNDEKNLKQNTEHGPIYYHSTDNAAKEANDWFQQLNLDKVGLLCIYGIGLGYYYDAAREWLKKDPSRQLVFLEDDLQVIYFFFQTEKATALLNDPQVQLLYFKDISINDNVLEQLYWNSAMSALLVTGLNIYTIEKKEQLEELQHKLYYDFTLKNGLIDEYLKYGTRFFYNFYQNILELPGAYLGNKLYGKFINIPAIICGAGPSLSKHLSILSQLSERALIFAGGSAMNALNSAGIKPHVGAGIDPNPTQLDRIKNNTAYEVPFFYRNRIYPEALKLISGFRLYITGCGGYDVSSWYEEKLNIVGEDLDEGHNVVNFCLQTAKQLGCNPIIFIGVDLGFTDSKSYAPGIEDHTEFDPNKAARSGDVDNKPILQTDIYGHPLYTLWKWVAESEWIGEFAKENPELTLINCTEGGLGFPDIVNRPLVEVFDEYLTRCYPIAEQLHGEIQNSRLKVSLKKILNLTAELQQSLKKCIEYLSVLIGEAHSNLKNRHEFKSQPAVNQSGYAALCEIELAEEPGYKFVIEMFNAVKTKLLEHEIAKGKFISEFDQIQNKLEVNIKRLSFLKEASQANVTIIDLALDASKKNKIKKKSIPQIDLNQLNLPQIEIKDFEPILIPKNPKDAMVLPKGHIVRMIKTYGKKKPIECRLELQGTLDGQCLLFYPNGKMKIEMFYKQGLLHGPVTFFSSGGKKLSISLFIEGKREGYTYLYYLQGALYARLEYLNNLLHENQFYYFPNGNLKSHFYYQQGILLKDSSKTLI